MKREIVIVVEDIVLTRFMRDADMFDSFKFAGRLLTCTQVGEPTRLTAPKLLERLTKNDGEGFRTVGVIIPNADAAFEPNAKVLSNGVGWCTVADICKSYNSALLEKEG